MVEIVAHPVAPAPHMARRHYPRVLVQLLWRMRLDLLVMAALCLGAGAFTPVRLSPLMAADGLQSTLGISVSVFLAFRNTQAINRWWEARSLWGAVVNQSRHWRDSLLAVLPMARQHRREQMRLLQLQVLLVWLLNFELRGFAQAQLRQRVVQLAVSLGCTPGVTVQQLCRRRALALQRLFEQGAISDVARDALIRSVEALTDAIGGLQKIRNTPIPPAYDAFVRLIAWLYGYELFINFDDSGLPLIGALLFFGFLVAERIGAYVEGPFDRDPHSFSLPLDQICLGISEDLLDDANPFADCPRCADPSIWT